MGVQAGIRAAPCLAPPGWGAPLRGAPFGSLRLPRSCAASAGEQFIAKASLRNGYGESALPPQKREYGQ